jgi:PIN domain nuclease of toxin-antitoxin system
MSWLLDTGVFIWARSYPERLNRRASELVSSDKETLFLSAASAWEIGIKYNLGKLALPEAPARYVPNAMNLWRIQALEINHRHALSVSELPPHHQDPFDRILIAQAKLEGMTLLTADRIFEKYDVEIMWCGT